MSNPAVGIGIVNWNQKELLRNCLSTLFEKTRYSPFQVMVFDNGSTDHSAEMVEQEFPACGIVRATENLGYPKAVNHLFSMLDTPLLAQINNDILVHEGWLTPLVELFDRYPRVGMAAGRVLFPSGKTQTCGSIIGPIQMAYRQTLYDPGPRFDQLLAVGYHGPYFVVRKAAWDQVSGFEERYSPGYGEDAEMGVDLSVHGWDVVFDPRSTVTHLGTQTGALFDKKKFLAFTEHHRMLFAFRNYPQSWLAIHCAVEPVKLGLSIVRGYFRSYLEALGRLWRDRDQIAQRRRSLNKMPGYRTAFPSWRQLLVRCVAGPPRYDGFSRQEGSTQ